MHEEIKFHAKWLLESEGFITESEHPRILYKGLFRTTRKGR